MQQKTILTLFALLLLCSLALSARPRIVAHRGYWRCAGSAQNSIYALQMAHKIGAWASEFDVHITRDGVLVINHNDDIGGIRIEDSDYRYISSQRLSNGELLPTLDTYLKAAKPLKGLHLVLELKAHATPEKEHRLVDSVCVAVKRSGLEKRIIYTSFSLYACRQMRLKAPKATILYLKGGLPPEEIKRLGLSGMNYHPAEWTHHPRWMEQARKLGLITGVWTMDNVELVEKFGRMGAYFVSSNSPLQAIELAKKLK